jgi:hypothetical protein
MNRRTDDTTQGDGLSSAADPARRRQRSWEVDVQRARALRGDTLEELTESQREWVWRSLLRGCVWRKRRSWRNSHQKRHRRRCRG